MYGPYKKPATQLRELKKILKIFPEGQAGWPGYIYGFRRVGYEAHIKIGKISWDPRKKIDPDELLNKRLQGWANHCHYDVERLFAIEFCEAAWRFEGVVHRHLQAFRRKYKCHGCGTARKRDTQDDIDHQEWFEIDAGRALAVVKLWKRFNDAVPYDGEHGFLKNFWLCRIKPVAKRGRQSVPHLPLQTAAAAAAAATRGAATTAAGDARSVSAWIEWFLSEWPPARSSSW